jgi:hypothetical protein
VPLEGKRFKESGKIYYPGCCTRLAAMNLRRRSNPGFRGGHIGLGVKVFALNHFELL